LSRWDCISINEHPVDAGKFQLIERHYRHLNIRKKIHASPFELLTATAFHLFNEEEVDVGVVEVGMGGKLDATNILNNQAVSVISKIARDHEGFLGNTLGEIARHKAGILRPNVPYIVNPRNESNVQQVIYECAKEVGAGPRLSSLEELYSTPDWRRFSGNLRAFQRDNAVLAVLAVQETLKSMEKNRMSGAELAAGLMQHRHVANPGRLQYLRAIPVFGSPGSAGREILVDGAHNPDAAIALDDFVSNNERRRASDDNAPPNDERAVTWVLAMTEGKDAEKYLKPLLRPGDNVITTSFDPVDGMPWVKPTPPEVLLEAAKTAEPGITGIAMPKSGPLRALCAARYLAEKDHPIVLTGSLYLVGNLLKDLRSSKDKSWWSDELYEQERAMFKAIHAEERERIYRLLSGQNTDVSTGNSQAGEKAKEAAASQKALQDEIKTLDEELERLDAEERQGPIRLPQIVDRITQLDKHSSALPLPSDDKFLSRIVEVRKSLEALLKRPRDVGSRPVITDTDMQLQMLASNRIGHIAELRKRKKEAEKTLRSIPNEELSPDRQTLAPKIHLHYSQLKGVEPRRSRAATLEMGRRGKMGEDKRAVVRKARTKMFG
jgi:folylpolyglutamate synthase/dihydrofolate synthase